MEHLGYIWNPSSWLIWPFLATKGKGRSTRADLRWPEAMLPVEADKFNGGHPEMALSMADAGAICAMKTKTALGCSWDLLGMKFTTQLCGDYFHSMK